MQSISTWLLHHLRDSGTPVCAARDDTLPDRCVRGPGEINKQSVDIFCASVSFSSLVPPSLRFHESRSHQTRPSAWQTAAEMIPIKVMRTSVELIIMMQTSFQFVRRWHWIEWKVFNVWNLKESWILARGSRVTFVECFRRDAAVTYSYVVLYIHQHVSPF